MILNRLALGTANFGKEYNGVKVSEDEQKRILDYCQQVGIDMIDTATAYDWDWTKAKGFNIVVKINENDTIGRIKEIVNQSPYCLMAHTTEITDSISCFIRHTAIKKGISVYSEHEIRDYFQKAVSIVQLPYSIFDRRLESKMQTLNHVKIHVRSVFLRGKILEKFTPWECIAFCLMNPYVDRVIIGVDSLEQLKEDLEPFHRMNAAQIQDQNILDPRRWEGPDASILEMKM